MTTLADMFVRVRPDMSHVGPELKREGERHGKTFGGVFARSTAGPLRAVGGILSTSIGGVVAGLGAVAGIKVFAGFITDAQDSAKVAKLTESTIRATGGAAKITATAVGNLATAISNKTGKDDEAIQSGQNMLLTFKGIRNEAGKNNDIFNQASSVLTDMVAAMNGGVVSEENMRKGGIQLGKALNDPIKGITALQRVGVTFTDGQKKQIAAMVKVGNVAGAQKIILGELKSEFGGAAAATSTMSDRMKVSLGNLGETIGGFLLPVLNKVIGFITKSGVPGLMAMFAAFREGDVTSDGFVGTMERIGVAARIAFNYFKTVILPRLKEFASFIVTQVIPAVVGLVGWLWRNKDVVVALAGVFAAVKLTLFVQSILAVIQAVRAWIVVQGGLNAVLFANPIGIVIGVLALLVAAVILAYRHSETFRKFVDKLGASIQTAWGQMRAVIGAVSSWFTGTIYPSLRTAYIQLMNILGNMRNTWNNVWHAVQNTTSAVGQWFSGILVGSLRTAYGQLMAVGRAFRTAWNAVWGAVRAYIQLQISVVMTVFNALKNFITVTLPNAFKTGVAAIGRIWAGLQELAKRPVRFIVDTVINGAIIGTFNKVSGFFGGPKVSPVSLPRGFGDGPGITAPRRPAAAGTGDGPGDFLSFLKGPANWIKSRTMGKLGQVGDNPFAQMLKGMGGKLVASAIDKAKLLLGASEAGGGGTVGTGGLRTGILSVLAALRAAFGNVGVISGFRPGARTLSGNLSYHALGRAIDIAPVRAWAAFLAATFGSRLRELITPWQQFNRLNGYPHTYTGAVWNQHNFAGGNAHIHAAMDNGGYLMPGWNLRYNGTGKIENLVPAGAGDIHIHIHDSVIASERQAVDLFTRAYNTAKREKKIR
jgi:hypothetical protein